MALVLKYTEAQFGAAKPFSKKVGREEAQARTSYTSRTVYIGNLAFVTIDAQLHALFSRCGPIERIIMGLNRTTKQPCGFAFIIFMLRESAVEAVTLLHGSVLDERIIKVEMDKGWYPGREFGRGESGAQVRDELRTGYDEGRGGFSVREQQQLEQLEQGNVNDLGGGYAAGRGRRFSGGGPGWTPPHADFSGGSRPRWQQQDGRDRRRDSYGSGGVDSGGAGFKRRRGGEDDSGVSLDFALGGGGGGFDSHRPFRRDFRSSSDGGGGGGQVQARPSEDEEGQRRRRGRDSDGRGDSGVAGGEPAGELAEVDEFGRVRRPAGE